MGADWSGSSRWPCAGAAPATPSHPTADDVAYFRALNPRFSKLNIEVLSRLDRFELNNRKLDDDGLGMSSA